MFEHEIVRRVVDGADFLNDDVLFARDLVGIEARMGQNVGKNVESQADIGLEDPCIVSGGLDAGAGVEIAADRLDLLGDLTGGAARRPLERHVLEKVRDAVLVRMLVAAAAGNPAAERGGVKMWHGVGDHDQSGGETGNFDAHAGTPSRATRLWERM